MLEYLIRVECEFGTFMVHAGGRAAFARQMIDTFALRDKNNKAIPHSKTLVEIHVEPNDMGSDGPVELPLPEASFEDFEETPEQARTRLLAEAEERISRAAAQLEKVERDKQIRESRPKPIAKKWGPDRGAT